MGHQGAADALHLDVAGPGLDAGFGGLGDLDLVVDADPLEKAPQDTGTELSCVFAQVPHPDLAAPHLHRRGFPQELG